MGGFSATELPSAKRGTIVFDLDGVLYVDREGVPGAGDALRALQGAGFELVYATNNATKTPDTVVRHLEERTGFTADPDAVVTSAMAAAEYLRGMVSSVFVLGSELLAATLAEASVASTEDWRNAEAVVVGLDLRLSYERLATASLAVRNGALLVATNVDETYPTPEGLKPGAGSIVAAVATAGGVDPVVCGKPNPPMRELVRRLVDDGPVWVVGDRPETDIALGALEGWSTVLVLTGVHSGPTDDLEWQPDIVLDSVAELPQRLL